MSYALYQLLVRENQSNTYCTMTHSFWWHIQPFLHHLRHCSCIPHRCITLPCSSDTFLGMWIFYLTCSNWSKWHVLPLQILFSLFHLSPLAGPTVWPWVRSFISVLRTTLLVYTRFILSAQVDGIDLPFYCRFYFQYFTFLTTSSSQYSATACGIHQRSVDFISSMYVFFYVYLNRQKWPVLWLHILFSGFFFLSDSLELPMLNNGWYYSLKVFGTHKWYVNYSLRHARPQ